MIVIPTIKKPIPDLSVNDQKNCTVTFMSVRGKDDYDNEYFNCEGLDTCEDCILSDNLVKEGRHPIDILVANKVITKEYALELELESHNIT